MTGPFGWASVTPGLSGGNIDFFLAIISQVLTAVIARSASDEAIQTDFAALDCFASLAMTWWRSITAPLAMGSGVRRDDDNVSALGRRPTIAVMMSAKITETS